ncbi:ABC transporter permease [Arvimicrobium flavum]|uniref:ABC transporter permease n=1 Tax=Arvimicrobium flavum TaxID=3393320 RepID=UPI00237B9B72|nr:ABC transporter permease [Mesorhizobium shangrilense]
MLGLLDRVSPQVLRIGALVAVILLILAFFGTQIDNYYDPRLFVRISTSVAIMALIAVGQALVVITRNIDLSVGSVVGFTAYATGNLVIAHPDLNPLFVVLYAILVGAGFGVVNGVLVAYAKIPSIIVTLGTLALYRTLLVDYSGAKSITTGDLPAWIVELPRINLFSIGGIDIRVTFAVAVLVVIVAHLALTRLRVGRMFYAVGSNPDAAVMAGINSARVIFTAFLISGALAGLAGFMFLSRFGNITVVAGLGFELKSVAAVVVGGVNIFGGSGTVIGTLLGAILVDLLETSLVRWQLVSEFWREAVLGFLILLSVAADTILMRKLLDFRQKRARAEAKAGAEATASRQAAE